MTTTAQVKTGVIAAAGSATRMWPASKVVPKELFPLGRVPAIAHVVSEFVQAGIKKIVLVVAEQNLALIRGLFDRSVHAPPKVAGDTVVQHFEALLDCAEFVIISQTGHYGNATPLVLAADEVGSESCIYAFGDDVVFGENSSLGLIDVHGKTGRPVLAAQEVDPSKKSSFGIIESRFENGVHYVTRLIEKPRADETASNLASFGRYLVTPDLMQVLKATRPGRDSEVWFVDGVIHELARQKHVCVFPLTAGTWYTVGDPRSYADAVGAAQNASTPDFIARVV